MWCIEYFALWPVSISISKKETCEPKIKKWPHQTNQSINQHLDFGKSTIELNTHPYTMRACQWGIDTAPFNQLEDGPQFGFRS